MIAVKVLFSGNVQGVGFRARTAKVAARHAVTGYVKNLDDGRVELVAEGAEAEVRAFLSAVKARLSSHISRAEESFVPVETFSDFRIAYG